MLTPTWVANLNDGFDPTAIPIIVYTSLLLWFNSNLDRDETTIFRLGGKDCWPRRGITRQHDVRICLNFILTRLGWNRMQEQAFGHYVSELLERFILIAQQEVDFVLHTRQQLHTHLL